MMPCQTCKCRRDIVDQNPRKLDSIAKSLEDVAVNYYDMRESISAASSALREPDRLCEVISVRSRASSSGQRLLLSDQAVEIPDDKT
jgi:hypothetical protein